MYSNDHHQYASDFFRPNEQTTMQGTMRSDQFEANDERDDFGTQNFGTVKSLQLTGAMQNPDF